MEQHRASVTIAGFADHPVAGEMEFITWSRPDRLRRAWTGLGACWALAAGALFIPVAHFLLVPGFALAGPLVFFRRVRRGAAIGTIRGACPDCGTAQAFAVGGPPRPSMEARCGACHRGLTVRWTAPDP